MAYRPQVKTSNGMVDLPIDAETIKGKTLLEQTYPIGAIYLSVNNTSPASLFGGTWEQLKDKFLLGAGDTYSNGATGGEATHTLITNEMPNHEHRVIVIPTGQASNYAIAIDKYTQAGADNPVFSWTTTIDRNNVWAQATGGGQAHNNMPPYLVVYIWKRIA